MPTDHPTSDPEFSGAIVPYAGPFGAPGVDPATQSPALAWADAVAGANAAGPVATQTLADFAADYVSTEPTPV